MYAVAWTLHCYVNAKGDQPVAGEGRAANTNELKTHSITHRLSACILMINKVAASQGNYQETISCYLLLDRK